MQTIVDTHIHLDDAAFDGDRDAVIQRSREAGVTAWINVAYAPDRWQASLQLRKRYPGMEVMLGVHPGNADGWSDDVGAALESLILRERPRAVGEIGIDLYWRQDNLPLQEEAFRAQLGIALRHDLPAVIHMRSSDRELLSVLASASDLPHIHFHSFDGGPALRTWALEHQATIGVGGLMTRRDSDDLRTWLAGIPRDRILLETDAPYLKPQGIRGKRNEPALLVSVAKRLAEIQGVTYDAAVTTTTDNARRVFGLPRR